MSRFIETIQIVPSGISNITKLWLPVHSTYLNEHVIWKQTHPVHKIVPPSSRSCFTLPLKSNWIRTGVFILLAWKFQRNYAFNHKKEFKNLNIFSQDCKNIFQGCISSISPSFLFDCFHFSVPLEQLPARQLKFHPESRTIYSVLDYIKMRFNCIGYTRSVSGTIMNYELEWMC
jgi:hypothetical protein